jgi:hypothetical protein
MLLLKILGGLVAVAIGLYLGLAGQYRPDPDEVDASLIGKRFSKRAKRHFTPLGWLRRDEKASNRRRRTSSRRFDLIDPDTSKKKS